MPARIGRRSGLYVSPHVVAGRAVLLVLYAAMRAHGIPEALVTDSGGVFLANHIRRIYEVLGIRKEESARRQPWQNLLEANFGTQARMADYGFANVATWEALLQVHEQWMGDYNAQTHWAHQRRDDGLRSPREVLAGAMGRPIDESALHRVFYTVRFGRVLGAEGYARFRHWRIYGERGLAGRLVGLWLYGPQLTLEYREEPLAQYRVAHAPGKRQFKAVTLHRLFETPFHSPQPWLFPLDEGQWVKAWRVQPSAPRRARRATAIQLPLFADDLLKRSTA